jgi:hypothetical protein
MFAEYFNVCLAQSSQLGFYSALTRLQLYDSEDYCLIGQGHRVA